MDNVEDKVDTPKPEPVKESGYMDIANVEVHCHVLIRDKDTGEVFVNKRG